MTAQGFAELLQEALDETGFDDVAATDSYESAGILTRNKGLVVRMANGDEFQVTIVQSAWGDGDDDQEEGQRWVSTPHTTARRSRSEPARTCTTSATTSAT